VCFVIISSLICAIVNAIAMSVQPYS